MARRATQLRILQTALELFNEHGTAALLTVQPRTLGLSATFKF